MGEHPIERLMDTAMTNIKEMVDVNTIVGDPVETPDGSVIIPISRVSFGFAAGGGELEETTNNRNGRGNQQEIETPFAGGSGAGVMLNPMAFLVVNRDQVRLLPVSSNAADRLINAAPELLNQIQKMIDKNYS